MNTINAGGMASMLLEQIRRIKTRTWVLISVVFLSCIALAVWAAIAVLGALWGGAQSLIGVTPNALEAAKRQVAQHAETLSAAKEQLAQSVPQLPMSVDQVNAELTKQADALRQTARDSLAQSLPDVAGAINQARQVGAQTVASAAAAAAAATAIAMNGARTMPVMPAEELPIRDVSGADLGPARFQGLARVAWHSDNAGTTVRYEGRADYHDVLSHYQREFNALGFSQKVISATQEHEALLFSKRSEVLTAKIKRDAGLISVEIADFAKP